MKYKPDYRDTMIAQLKQRLAEVEKEHSLAVANLAHADEKIEELQSYIRGHATTNALAKAREVLNQRKEGDETCATQKTKPMHYCEGTPQSATGQARRREGKRDSATTPNRAHSSHHCREVWRGSLSDRQNLNRQSMDPRKINKPTPPPVCGQTPTRVDAFVIQHAPIITGKQWTAFARELQRDLADTQSRCSDLAQWNTRLTRERDDLQAKYDDALKRIDDLVESWNDEHGQACSLRAQLDAAKAEVEQKKKMIEFHCRDWADDDTAIKAVCEKHGVTTESKDDYFKPAVECVEDLAAKLATLRAIVQDIMAGRHVTSMRMQEALNP